MPDKTNFKIQNTTKGVDKKYEEKNVFFSVFFIDFITFKPFNLDNIGRMGRNVFFLMQGFSKKLLVYSRKIWPNKNNIYKLIRGTRRRREKSDNNFSVTG